MSIVDLTDPAVKAVVQGCSVRAAEALGDQVPVIMTALVEEGHDPDVAALGCINAAATLLANLIRNDVLPEGRGPLLDSLVGQIREFALARCDACAVPAGVTIQ